MCTGESTLFEIIKFKAPLLSKKFKQLILSVLSTLHVNMCETGHSNLTFTTVEQKIAWEY